MEGEKKLNFFKRIKEAIFKPENYVYFASEGFLQSIKYFIKIMIVFSIIVSVAFTYKFYTIINNGVEYIKSDLPEFSLEEGILNFDIEEPLILEDESLTYSVIIDTLINNINENNYTSRHNLLKR